MHGTSNLSPTSNSILEHLLAIRASPLRVPKLNWLAWTARYMCVYFKILNKNNKVAANSLQMLLALFGTKSTLSNHRASWPAYEVDNSPDIFLRLCPRLLIPSRLFHAPFTASWWDQSVRFVASPSCVDLYSVSVSSSFFVRCIVWVRDSNVIEPLKY